MDAPETNSPTKKEMYYWTYRLAAFGFLISAAPVLGVLFNFFTTYLSGLIVLSFTQNYIIYTAVNMILGAIPYMAIGFSVDLARMTKNQLYYVVPIGIILFQLLFFLVFLSTHPIIPV